VSGETLRFQQMMNNVPVFKSELVIHFNPSNVITFTSDAHDTSIETISTTAAISREVAAQRALENLKIQGDYTVDVNDLCVTKINNQTKLVYRVVTNPSSGNGSWEAMVDAQNGLVLTVRDVAIYDRTKNALNSGTPKQSTSTMATTTGTALVYDPDPLSTVHVTYTGNYVDNNDATNASLDAARTAVTLPEIDLTAGVYKLKSSYVEIKDFEAPSKGLFTQSTSDFSYNRNQDGFEAVNAFYHLDKAYATSMKPWALFAVLHLMLVFSITTPQV